MHLLEAYANNCGVALGSEGVKPFTSYYPTPNKYITIQTESGQASKNYKYFNIVIGLIKRQLNDNNISVVQIGGENDRVVDGALHLQGKTSFSQTFYVIKNAMLHIGNDSFGQHASGLFNVPTVALFGPTYANVCQGYYRHPDSISIEADRRGENPSLSAVDKNNHINRIKPEEVANTILKTLKLGERLAIETKFIGEHVDTLEHHVILDKGSVKLIKGFDNIFIRNDLYKSKLATGRLLKHTKASIITDTPFDKDFLVSNLGRIKSIEYKINNPDSINLDFIKTLSLFKSMISTRLSGKDLFNLKLKLLELDVNLEVRENTLENKVTGKFFFSKKIFASGDKIYLSKYHWENDLAQPNTSFWGVTPKGFNQSFINSQEYYYSYDRN